MSAEKDTINLRLIWNIYSAYGLSAIQNNIFESFFISNIYLISLNIS